MEKLRAPFPTADLEWRVGRAFQNGKGVILPYVTARGIQERLDDVFGVDGWDNEFQVVDGGVICTLICRYGGSVFRKSDGASFTQVEPLKGGISGALKRAAVELGIGRYLYDLPEVIVPLENKKFFGKVVLPDEFLPESERTGNTQIRIESKGSRKQEKPKEPEHYSQEDIDAAMNFVVRNDKFNTGKKMSEVWNKSLKFIARGNDEEQARAARIVAFAKGVALD